MEELYKRNEDFKDYIDRYCTTHKICRELAYEHLLVKAIAVVEMTKEQKRKEGTYI